MIIHRAMHPQDPPYLLYLMLLLFHLLLLSNLSAYQPPYILLYLWETTPDGEADVS